ncbi:MAG: PLP-dependent transferase [Polyangiaceae bacterium]
MSAPVGCCLTSLEGGKHALTFASALGATTTSPDSLCPGDHIVCSDDVHGGTFRWIDRVMLVCLSVGLENVEDL